MEGNFLPLKQQLKDIRAGSPRNFRAVRSDRDAFGLRQNDPDNVAPVRPMTAQDRERVMVPGVDDSSQIRRGIVT